MNHNTLTQLMIDEFIKKFLLFMNLEKIIL